MPESKPTFLVVDDDPTIRIPISEFLTELGHSVRVAEDGLVAWEEIGREAPEILLSDLNMPRCSGFQLLSAVRRERPSIQTIAMSGMFCADEIPYGVTADAFFQKGSSLQVLLHLIEKLPSHPRHEKGPEPMGRKQ